MNRTNANDYRALMNRIEMPSRVHDRIAREAQALRAEDARRARPAPGPFRRRAARAFAVGCCALALAGGMAFALAAGANLGTGGQAGLSAPSAPPNSFSLVAYADENPEGASGKTVEFSLEDFGFESAWKVWNTDPEIDPNNIDPQASDGQRYLSVAYRFNLACTGTNVASLTYEIEGDRMLFYTRTNAPGAKSTVNSVEERGTSFTVGYDEQRGDPSTVWRALRASFPLEGELESAYDEMAAAFNSAARDEFTRASDRLGLMALRRYADAVAQSRLTVTATFTDGSTQTKTYVIAPIDRLEETMQAHVEAVRAQAAAFDPDNPPTEPLDPVPNPQLFTLTELAG